MVDEEIANLFKFTLRDNAFNWCNNYMWDNPNYKFANLEQALCRCYQKVQNDEQVYLQLNNLKQESIERIEVSCETLLIFFYRNVPITITILFMHCHYEKGDSATTQKVSVNLWRKYFYAWSIEYTFCTTNHRDRKCVVVGN
jgi:hypothetical protein